MTIRLSMLTSLLVLGLALPAAAQDDVAPETPETPAEAAVSNPIPDPNHTIWRLAVNPRFLRSYAEWKGVSGNSLGMNVEAQVETGNYPPGELGGGISAYLSTGYQYLFEQDLAGGAISGWAVPLLLGGRLRLCFDDFGWYWGLAMGGALSTLYYEQTTWNDARTLFGFAIETETGFIAGPFNLGIGLHSFWRGDEPGKYWMVSLRYEYELSQ